jgi:hypothetical protein
VGTTYPSHDDARDAVSNHVHIKSRLTEGGWLYLESIGIARPVVPIATAEKALEAARYELVKYVTNVFLKSPEYLAVYGTDAAAATAFRDSAQAFGTSASPAKTTTWSWGWSFDGLVNGVSTEVSVITDGTSEIAMQLE